MPASSSLIEGQLGCGPAISEVVPSPRTPIRYTFRVGWALTAWLNVRATRATRAVNSRRSISRAIAVVVAAIVQYYAARRPGTMGPSVATEFRAARGRRKLDLTRPLLPERARRLRWTFARLDRFRCLARATGYRRGDTQRRPASH